MGQNKNKTKLNRILLMSIFTSAVKVRMKVVKMTTAQQNLGESTANCRIIG